MSDSSVSKHYERIFLSKIEVSPEVIFQEISGETVILDLKSESYFGLDTTGTRIWELLQENQAPIDIVRIMSSEFDVDPDILKRDLAEHIDSLEKAELITLIEQ